MLNKLVRIQTGESLPFTFDRNGASIEDWTCQIFIKQRPDDGRTVDREILSDNDVNFKGFLTSEETLNLDQGLWYLIGLLQNIITDEQEEIPIRFSVTKSSVITPSVSPPVFSPPAGIFGDTVIVSISTTTPDAIIHFTTDGSEPTIFSQVFSTPIVLTTSGSPHTLKALAVKPGLIDSAVSSAIYNVQEQVLPVTFVPTGSPISTFQTINLSTLTVGATINYTINDGPIILFSSPFTLPAGNQTVKAIASLAGFIDSDETQETYTVTQPQVADVTFSPPPGIINDAELITLATVTAGAAINYTINDGPQILFVAPFTLPVGSQTVKAIASLAGFIDSNETQATYTVQDTVAPVTFSPVAGIISNTQLITLATTTPLATIHYTTDGTDPDQFSTVFPPTFLLPLGNQVVKAIALKAGFFDSVITQANYDVQEVVADVTFSPPAGDILSTQLITLATATPSATINYTINDGPQILFVAPFTLPVGSQTVKAIASRAGFIDSNETQAIYMVSAPFSPLDISNIVFWVDANDESSVTESVGGVSEWRDQSSNLEHLEQGVSTRRPSYNTAVTPHFVLFDAALNKTMNLDGTNFRAQPNTYFMVARSLGLLNPQIIFDSRVTQTNEFSESGGVWRMGANTPVSTGKSTNTNVNILTPIFNGSSSRFYVNGGSSNIFNPGSNFMSGFILAMSTTGTNFANYEFYDILFYSRLLTLDELNDLGVFFAAKHSLTWTTITV